MGRYHKEARQRVLFGPDRRDRSGNTSQWQSLPAQTRQKAVRLMARLFIEHCRTPGTEGTAHTAGSRPDEEGGDV